MTRPTMTDRERLEYDAHRWLEHPDNRDGWLVDPEATLALTEYLSDIERGGGDPMEELRRMWRTRMAQWRETGSLSTAAEVMSIEAMADEWSR